MKSVLKIYLFGIPLALAALTFQSDTEVKSLYNKTEHMIQMRDGVKLFTAIYTPKDQSLRYPIMLNRTPYSVAPYGPDAYRAALGPSTLFQQEKFIFVYQDVRGKLMSEGEFVDVRPHKAKKSGSKDID
jgi:predicted acyl esterase